GAAVRDHRCRDPRTRFGRCGRSRRVQDRPAPHGRHRLEPDGRTDGGPRRRRGGEGPRDRHRRRTAVRLPGIIAVDVGGTKIRAGSVVDGVLGHVRTVPTPASAGAQEILDTIAEAAAAVIAEAGRGGEDGTDRDAEAGHSAATGPGRGAAVSEWRIGVGAAGVIDPVTGTVVIDPVTGTVVSATDSLSGWAGPR